MMRISELIDALELAKRRWGDLPLASTDSFLDEFLPENLEVMRVPFPEIEEKNAVKIVPIFKSQKNEI